LNYGGGKRGILGGGVEGVNSLRVAEAWLICCRLLAG